jgi:alkaline phosphatase D
MQPSSSRRLLFSLAVSATLLATPGCTPGDAASDGVENALTTIAFGSCARQDRPQPIWDDILSHAPDLFLFIGDNIYADTEDMAVMREKYGLLGAQPGYARLVQSTPILATWDDHDFGVNDGGEEYPMKEQAQEEFLTFFNEPDTSPRWTRPGIYDAHVFGPVGSRVQVILLDTRFFRSPLVRWPEGDRPTRGPYMPAEDSVRTMLGEAQWTWLAEQLRVPAEVRIIASSIQVVPEEHGWEGWANFPHERSRLFRTIREAGAGGVLFISGDRHHAELSRLLDSDAGYPLFDVTSSGMNQGGQGQVPEPNRHRVSPAAERGDNYGLITLDWSLDDPLVRLELRRAGGSLIYRHETRLNELRAD